jgi:hypothetical protein
MVKITIPIFFKDSLEIALIKALKIKAKIAEKTAPIINSALLFVSIPRRIYVPKPPAPINAANVAVPMIITIAILNPEMIIGIAKGISILNSFFDRDNPNASAASFKSGSIEVNPE